MESLLKWDLRFLELAKFVAGWSKDPSTKTGAVIVNNDRQVVGMGYNGFPRGVCDDPERYADRELKYKMIVHSERNALLFTNGLSVKGCTLYSFPFASCSTCAAMIIQAGIVRCVAPPLPAYLQERWAGELQVALTMFNESGVLLDIVDPAKFVLGS